MLNIKSWQVLGKSNLQTLLDLRYEAEFAIMAAMDYAKHNLDCLRAKGYDVAGLNDTEKARIMYLCHHLGLGDAVHFIQNTIPEEDVFQELSNGKKRLKQNGAKKLLTVQVGEKKAEGYRGLKGNDGSWVKGHRTWLSEFIGNHIKPSVHSCPGEVHEQLGDQEIRSLIATTDRLKK